MKLRLTLILFCLLGVGLFARSQDKKKAQTNPTVENGADAIPVTVQSTKKGYRKPPPPQPPLLIKDGKPFPPPKMEVLRFAPPKIVKDMPKPPPQHKPTKTILLKPLTPDTPPPADNRA